MAQAINEPAFFEQLTPEALWRASCHWAGSGYTEQAEWLHEMAVELIDIHTLPEAPEEPGTTGAKAIRELLLRESQPQFRIDPLLDIDF